MLEITIEKANIYQNYLEGKEWEIKLIYVFQEKKESTPFRPMYSEICPLAIAPTIAPTFDKEPNKENWPDTCN